MATLGTTQDQNDDNIDILADVSLKSFNAQPTQIGPFGASVLSWEVTGPAGFHVELKRQQVAKKASPSYSPSIPQRTD